VSPGRAPTGGVRVGYQVNMRVDSKREIHGKLVKVKEYTRMRCYAMQFQIRGVSGSFYVERGQVPLWDTLVLTKDEETHERG
jgi:hypothetical protein